MEVRFQRRCGLQLVKGERGCFRDAFEKAAWTWGATPFGPRSGGGHILRRVRPSPHLPSPLTRGKRRLCRVVWHQLPSIPARTGQSSSSAITYLILPSPLARGNRLLEKMRAEASLPAPLARGKSARRLVDLTTFSVPAHAGQTPSPARPSSSSTFRPRSRGGNCLSRCGHISRPLPSPRVRGTVTRPSGTLVRSLPSPLARGMPDVCRRARVVDPSVPARAGET